MFVDLELEERVLARTQAKGIACLSGFRFAAGSDGVKHSVHSSKRTGGRRLPKERKRPVLQTPPLVAKALGCPGHLRYNKRGALPAIGGGLSEAPLVQPKAELREQIGVHKSIRFPVRFW